MGAENHDSREVGARGGREGKGRRKQRMDGGWGVGAEGRGGDQLGGGAVHLQIKFVIQASDGPTARD